MYGDDMKVQVGTIFMNRTRKYLLPLLKLYGNDFAKKVNSVFKVAIGIGDIITEKCGLKHEKHLFILLDSEYAHPTFVAFLDWIREQAAYEDDYILGNVQSSRFHMIVVKIPDKYLNTLEMFKEGKYSMMYQQEDIRRLFDFSYLDRLKIPKEEKEFYHDIVKVLIRDNNYKLAFAKQIELDFNIPKFSPDDIPENSEYDFPITKQEEFFNFYKQGQELS